MLSKMPGATKEEKLRSLRAAYAFMYTHPGKKLLFMGQDMGLENEWREGAAMNWDVANDPQNKQFMDFVKALNKIYQSEKALHEQDYVPEGFEWINNISANECVVSFVRKASSGDELVVVANFTPVERDGYKIGVPHQGKYKEIFNSNDVAFGGDGVVNKRVITSKKDECDGRENSIKLTLPSMGVTILRYTEASATVKKDDALDETIKETTAKKSAKKTATKTASTTKTAAKTATKTAAKTTTKKTTSKK